MIQASTATKKDVCFKKLFPYFTFEDIRDGSYRAKVDDAITAFNRHADGWQLYESRDAKDDSLVRATVLSNCRLPANSNKLPLCEESDNTVILYAGGGGYLASLQLIQEGFLVGWAKNTNITIFEAFYSLCPERQYPYQINELFNLYMQIVLHYKLVQNVGRLRMVLMGDSAGGGIAASLMNMLAAVQVDLPCELHLVYPAIDFRVDRFTPSVLHSLDDKLLYFTVAKQCFDAYVPTDANAAGDWLLSAAIAPDHIFQRYPKTFVYSGDKDSLKDDCLRLAYRVNKANDHGAQLVEIEGLYHGFLGFKLPLGFGISETTKLHALVERYLSLGIIKQ